MGVVAELWRHPIKSHGREALTAVTFDAGCSMPWDRHWAVTHGQSKFDGTHWAKCRNFMIGAMTPSLAGVWAELFEETGQVTLRHQDIGAVTFSPDLEPEVFLEWVAPLCPSDRSQPTGLVKADNRGMTDTDYPSISLMNCASHRAVEHAFGHPVAQERWRANIWLEGLEPWQERDWIGKTVRIGNAEFEVRENCRRCMHTAANPTTGVRDLDTLGVLNASFGHQDFGVYAVVTKTGRVEVGAPTEVL